MSRTTAPLTMIATSSTTLTSVSRRNAAAETRGTRIAASVRSTPRNRRSRALRCAVVPWSRSRCIAGAALVIATAAACSSGSSHRQATVTPSTSRQTVPDHIVDAPTTTTTGPSRKPVVLAFAGDVHFEGVLRDKLADQSDGSVRADRAAAVGGRPRDGEPRDRDHRARHAATQGVHVPSAADGVHGGAVGRCRCRLDGEQPRRRLRAGRPLRFARRDSADEVPRRRHRRRRRRRRTRRTERRFAASASRSSARPRCSTTR